MGKQNRGFASASPQRRKELAEQGSAAALKSNRRHRFAHGEEARAASQKGLKSRRLNRLNRIISNHGHWLKMEVKGHEYMVFRMPSPFELQGVSYPEGSWLIWNLESESPLAALQPELLLTVMLDSDFHIWKIS